VAVESALLYLVRLHNVLNYVVELADPNYFIIKAFHLAHEVLYIFLYPRQDAAHGRLDHHFILSVDSHLKVDLLFASGCQQQYLLFLYVIGMIEVQLLHWDEHAFYVESVFFFELGGEEVDVVDEEEGNGLQLVELEHHAHLVDQLQLLLYADLLLEVDVESQQVAQHLVHQLKRLGDRQLKLLQQLH
jgi:hypothetical protein